MNIAKRSLITPILRSFGLKLVALTLAAFGVMSEAQAQLKVSVMPSHSQSSSYAKVGLNEAINVWGRTWGGTGAQTYTLDFGDGTAPATGSVTNANYIGASHVYTTGGLKTFTLTVTDSTSTSVSRSGVIRVIAAPVHADRVHMAIEKGLLNLYQNYTVVDASRIYWINPISPGNTTDYGVGATAAAILAFEENDHLPGEDDVEEIYAETLRRGLNTFFAQATPFNIGAAQHSDGIAMRDTDMNDNGRGIYFTLSGGHAAYSNPFAGMAIILAKRNAAEASASTIPYGPFAGVNYLTFVQDLADQLHWTQGDGSYRGGFGYEVTTASQGRFDGSSQQWPALMLLAAEERLGVHTPQWWLDNAAYGFSALTSSAPNAGGIAYYSANDGWTNTAKTGGALALYSFAGRMAGTDANATAARNFIQTNWANNPAWYGDRSGWAGHWYAMWALKKGLQLQGITTLQTGTGARNWKQDMQAWLLGNATLLDSQGGAIGTGYRSTAYMFGQQADGSWRSTEYPGSGAYASAANQIGMDTAHGILILSESVARPVPVAVIAAVGSQTNKAGFRAFAMDGSGSYHLDANSSIIEYLWDWNAADGVDWANPDATGPRPNNPGYSAVGNYTVTLRVKDNQNPFETGTSTIVVNVIDTDIAPVAVAIPSSLLPAYAGRVGQPIQLDGTSSFDADGDAITLYSWDTDGNGTYGDATGPTPTVTFNTPYVGQVGLRVTANGKTSTNSAIADIYASATDFYIESISSSNIVLGVSADVQVVVKNATGSMGTHNGVTVRFYNGDPLGNGVQIGSNYTVNLTPEGTATLNASLTNLNGLQVVYAYVDATKVISEWDEKNNTASVNVAANPEIEVYPGTIAGTGIASFSGTRSGSTVLVSDGAVASASEFDDHIDSISVTYASPTSLNVAVQWAPTSSGSFTAANGVHFNLFHYNGSTWTNLVSDNRTPAQFVIDQHITTNYNFTLPPGAPAGTHYLRATIIDKASGGDVMVGNIASGTSGTASASGRHFDNADVSFDVSNASPIVDGSESFDFGKRHVAETSTQAFTIKNIGTGPLNLGAITFDGANPGDFTITTAPVSPVPVNGTTSFVVTFMPLQAGARTAVLHLANSDANENPFDITLTGTGTNFIGSTLPDGITPVVTLPPGGSFDARGLNFGTDLGFVPTPGTSYTFINILGTPPSGIIGNFNDLPENGVVAMSIGGQIYYFQAKYTAGVDGNDLVLTNFTPSGPPAWTWTAGPKSRNGVGIYGVRNTPAPTNNPGARQGAMNWLAQDGSLWMFGGYGYANSTTSAPQYLNDLWQYDRSIGQWVWRKGANIRNQYGTYSSADPNNLTPGSRHTGTTWTDTNGDLWLFGGYGLGASGTLGRLNDLWRFDIGTGQWTWVKGSSSTNQPGVYTGAAAALTPGARQGATSWATSDDVLWLFGGTTDGGTTHHNDLWRFDIATGNWTPVTGNGTINVNGTYAAINAPGYPGARRDATGWVGADGTLWLFGGRGLAGTGATLGDMSDLWRFNPVTGVWTWINGPSAQGAAGTYNALNATGAPSSRSAGSGWRTADGKFWLVGGFKNSAQSLNDVWIYDPVANTWTWKIGSNTTNATGSYGTLGVADSTSHPSARFTPSTWVTLNGDLWLFGGGGIDSFGNGGRLSDLWSYGIPNPANAPYEPIPEPFPDSMIVNADPRTFDASAGTAAFVPVSGQLTGTDPDGDKILFSSVGDSVLSQGTLTLNANGTWTYTPANGFTGTAAFQFKANDSYGGASPVRTLVITVSTNLADTDGDGIADGYEYQQWGSIAAVDGDGDADLDGQSNYFEFLAGTSPLDANQRLSTAPSVAGTSGANGTIKLKLTHVRTGVNYHLETSTDLDIWSRIGTFTFSVAGSAEIEDPTPPTSIPKFYRLNLEATPAVIQP